MHSKQPGTASGQPGTWSTWNHCCCLAESQGSSQPHLDQAVGVVGAWMTLARAGRDGDVPEHLVRGQRVRFTAYKELVRSLHFAETQKLRVGNPELGGTLEHLISHFQTFILFLLK